MAENQFIRACLKASGATIVRSPKIKVEMTRYNTSKALSTAKEFRDEINKLINANKSSFEDVPILQSNSLNKLNVDQLEVVLKIVANMTSLMNSATKNVNITDNTAEIANDGFKVLKQALIEAGANIEHIAFLQKFSDDALNQRLYEIENNHSVREGDHFKLQQMTEADLELVAALRLAGVDLKLTTDSSSSVAKWTWDKQFSKSIMTLNNGSHPYTFTHEQVDALIDNYLNAENRGDRIITPEGLFAVLKAEESKKTYNITTDEIKQIKKYGDRFSASSPEFRAMLLLTPQYLNKHITRQLTIEMFENMRKSDIEFLKSSHHGVVSADETFDFSEELKEAMESDDVARLFHKKVRTNVSSSKPFKNIESLDELTNISNQIVSRDIPEGVDILSEFNDCIQILRQREDDASEKLVEQLVAQRQYYVDNLEFRRQFVDHWIEENIGGWSDPNFTDGFKNAIGRSGAYIVTRDKDGGIQMEGSRYDSSSHVGKIVEHLRTKGRYSEKSASVNGVANQPASATENLAEEKAVEETLDIFSTTYPDIFDDFARIMSQKEPTTETNYGFHGKLQDYLKLIIAEVLLRPGNPLGEMYDNFISDPKNKGKTFENFLDVCQIQKEGEQFLDRDTLREAFARTREKDNDAYKKERDAATFKEQGFQKYLLWLDLASKSFTPEEYAKYVDPSVPQDVKDKMIASKIEDAKIQFNNMTPDARDKAMKEAMLRHENYVKHKMISDIDLVNDLANEEGGVFKGLPFTTSMKNYLDELLREQAKNNEGLDKPVNINNGPEEQQAENPDDIPPLWKKFKELYPSPPNKEKYLKSLKFYSKSELIKKFLVPLKEAIDNTKIDMNAKRREAARAAAQNNAEATSPEPKTGDGSESEAKVDNDNNTGTPDGPRTDSANEAPATGGSGFAGEKKTETIQISQDVFESSIFMPGAVMFDQLAEANKGNGEYQNLSYFMNYLSTTEKDGFSEDPSDRYDLRHDLRQMCFEILDSKGQFYDSATIEAKCVENLAKYPNVPEDVKAKLQNACKMLTPELLLLVLKSTSTLGLSDMGDGSHTTILNIGSKLPVDKLSKLQTDAQRRDVMKDSAYTESISSIESLFEGKTIEQIRQEFAESFGKKRMYDDVQLASSGNELELEENINEM